MPPSGAVADAGDLRRGFDMVRYCVVCIGYQPAYVLVTDGDSIDITCAECGTLHQVPRYA